MTWNGEYKSQAMCETSHISFKEMAESTDRTVGYYVVGNGKLPFKATRHSAGHDLFASETVEVPPGAVRRVPTSVGVWLPPRVYGRITGRSSLSAAGILVAPGVIDRDFYGLIQVIVYNFTQEPYTIQAGDRCAQIVLERCYEAAPVASDDRMDMFFNDKRGSDGFGSTGRN